MHSNVSSCSHFVLCLPKFSCPSKPSFFQPWDKPHQIGVAVNFDLPHLVETVALKKLEI